MKENQEIQDLKSQKTELRINEIWAPSSTWGKKMGPPPSHLVLGIKLELLPTCPPQAVYFSMRCIVLSVLD